MLEAVRVCQKSFEGSALASSRTTVITAVAIAVFLLLGLTIACALFYQKRSQPFSRSSEPSDRSSLNGASDCKMKLEKEPAKSISHSQPIKKAVVSMIRTTDETSFPINSLGLVLNKKTKGQNEWLCLKVHQNKTLLYDVGRIQYEYKAQKGTLFDCDPTKPRADLEFRRDHLQHVRVAITNKKGETTRYKFTEV